METKEQDAAQVMAEPYPLLPRNSDCWFGSRFIEVLDGGDFFSS
jgi:hypothetical protein